ncbi:hypothetical protein RL72_01585 [Microbacterium azadirachtae]|uniref:PknH-like extracellular domain-containing protein n=1 Tax=Microbacterium azadirachtae TaxID=582680 RepID=A0A0F0KVC8_9MICO|nr:hypothetical protein [Microbacterium azadirachtae]KJL24862.1 hypothetical protein RL72_01585 [Microbacterium azadirachtae]
MKKSFAAAVLLAGVVALSGCNGGATEQRPVAKADAATLEPTSEPTPTPTPTPELFPVIGSFTSDVANDTGYTAKISATWSSLVRLSAADAKAKLPECAKWIDLIYKGGATDGIVYVARVTGTIEYPSVNGFQWPAGEDINLAMTKMGSGNAQATCEEPYIDKTTGTMPAAPEGGAFVRTAIWPVSKTPKNPDAELRPAPGSGLASPEVPVQDYINSDLRISTFQKVTCTNASDVQSAYGNACRFSMPIPVGQ